MTVLSGKKIGITSLWEDLDKKPQQATTICLQVAMEICEKGEVLNSLACNSNRKRYIVMGHKR